MSRRKPAAADATGAKRPKRANNLYTRPEKIPLGTILTDALNVPWKVGPSIGSGGFGEIYCAYCFIHAAPKTVAEYPNVVKIEPHENGPLFVETHFYRKLCKVDDIERYRKLRKLKHLGMPYYLASGSHTLNNVKHRFLVIPRFGASLQSVYVQNKNCLPLSTVCRAAMQMLDVLEYIHSNQYVHADLKGDNILFGMGDRGRERLYLVDFGMASRIVLEDQFKPDPRKKHNGTIEYTSRDAHQGVMTMRGDLEILAYNMIEWAGGSLPWKEEKLLKDCNKVQQMKEEGMSDVAGLLKQSFRKHVSVPKVLQPFLEFVNGLRYNEPPKYTVCSKIFEKALKTLGATNTGVLELSVASASNVNDSSGPMNKTKTKKRRTLDTSVSNGLADTVPNTPNDNENTEDRGPTPKRNQKTFVVSPSLMKQTKQRTANRSRTVPDTEPNTPEDEDDSPVFSQRAKRRMDRSDASFTVGSTRIKKPLLPNPQNMALVDTVPNTPEEVEETEDLSRALSKSSRVPKTEPVRGKHDKKVTLEDARATSTRRKEKTVTVVQSASAQGINIRIETPRKKRTRNVASESPQEITIKLTLNANVSVNTRSRKNGTVVVSASQQNMSMDSSRNDESLEASQDVIDVSSATEENNVSRSLFDDY
ncbi:serine/threonine-protein kinase VRK1 [Anopheles maculipalpis]|uniref:serine/threonine-protein kinase VRK1 n=1 Tax=Anopheles maculipalpis TaxID=1496333 RepID=UPI002158E599|nr:serine/threonine-protein kinase VRK1 [Anopheles maculipalpis]